MDRLNWKMTSNKNYMSIINTLIRWVSNPEYFKKTIIRAGYFTSVYWVINHRDYYLSSNLFTYLIILKDLSLLNDKFYTEYYKKPLCKLVNDNLRGEDKSELLVSFLCDSL